MHRGISSFAAFIDLVLIQDYTVHKMVVPSRQSFFFIHCLQVSTELMNVAD